MTRALALLLRGALADGGEVEAEVVGDLGEEAADLAVLARYLAHQLDRKWVWCCRIGSSALAASPRLAGKTTHEDFPYLQKSGRRVIGHALG